MERDTKLSEVRERAATVFSTAKEPQFAIALLIYIAYLEHEVYQRGYATVDYNRSLFFAIFRWRSSFSFR